VRFTLVLPVDSAVTFGLRKNPEPQVMLRYALPLAALLETEKVSVWGISFCRTIGALMHTPLLQVDDCPIFRPGV
jgi:hypothetical protein